ncbi:MAG TPA: hypothetical protein VGQ39_18470 [Pyrinomonadaceae bacterium]|nr:hypothetical protein [Pyrinomonadaceae bacterium]
MSSLAETAVMRFKTLCSEKLKARQSRRQETSSLISFAGSQLWPENLTLPDKTNLRPRKIFKTAEI